MRNSIWTALLVAAALAGAGCSGGKSEGSSSVAAHEAFGRLSIEEMEAKMADAKAGKIALFVYDNNDKGRFEKGHLPGAKWVDHDDVKASDLPQDKNATLVFYCANEH